MRRDRRVEDRRPPARSRCGSASDAALGPQHDVHVLVLAAAPSPPAAPAGCRPAPARRNTRPARCPAHAPTLMSRRRRPSATAGSSRSTAMSAADGTAVAQVAPSRDPRPLDERRRPPNDHEEREPGHPTHARQARAGSRTGSCPAAPQGKPAVRPRRPMNTSRAVQSAATSAGRAASRAQRLGRRSRHPPVRPRDQHRPQGRRTRSRARPAPTRAAGRDSAVTTRCAGSRTRRRRRAPTSSADHAVRPISATSASADRRRTRAATTPTVGEGADRAPAAARRRRRAQPTRGRRRALRRAALEPADPSARRVGDDAAPDAVERGTGRARRLAVPRPARADPADRCSAGTSARNRPRPCRRPAARDPAARPAPTRASPGRAPATSGSDPGRR